MTAALAVAGLSACDTTHSSADGKLVVVATTTQVADFARNIGGENVSVHQLLKPGIDPHEFEPSAADTKILAEADIVVENGVGLERWLDSSITAAGFHGPKIDTSKGVQLRSGEGEEKNSRDPHIWHDPRNATIMASNIEKALAAKDKVHRPSYEKNYRSYATKLAKLDADSSAKLESLPQDQRKLVTNHDAFGYYVQHYRLDYVGSVIPSFDTSAELSSKDIDALVAKIKRTGTKAIFSESSLPAKTAQTIGKEAGVKVIAGENALYGDSLGPRGSAGDTYLKAEAHNTATIVRALS